MNISSTPFIRNDYWPDYNDINELNKRIDETENEISLVNIRLSTDIENVSNNLNSYINNQANTTIANNIIVNSLNANYAKGKFANFSNTNTDNAYVENLTVNKPVFDITLNTPHIENTTSLGGNFYNANLVNPSFTEIDSMELNSLSVNSANIGELFVNTQPEPVTSSAVLGYDSDGRVIPVHAAYDVSFPENANYLFTDSHGTAFAGIAATEVGETNNLITSFAVKNALDDYANTVNESFNLVNNSLNDIDSWQNNLENNIANSFNDVNNGFNDVNNFVNNGFNDVNNTFNDVNNSFVEYTSILNILNTLIPASFSNASIYNSNSTTVNYRNVRSIEFTTPADTTGANISVGPQNPVYIKFDSATNTLKYTSNALVINETMFRVFNATMNNTFYSCSNLNQNILIPNSVTDMIWTFRNCSNLNQNILIPNSVTKMDNTFCNCSNLNQNILIPNSVTTMLLTFDLCNNLNQNILIPNSVTKMIGEYHPAIIDSGIVLQDAFGDGVFSYCTSLNQNILIPNSVTNMECVFWGCTSLNQNILIPNSVNNMIGVFGDCTSLNQDIYIYSRNISNMHDAFLNTQVRRVHIPASVPKVTSNFMYNCLVNGDAGKTFAAANIINDIQV